MKDKDSYTLKEIADIAEAYFRIRGAAEGEVLEDSAKRYQFIHTHIPEFERDVPENVREQLTKGTHLGFLIDRLREDSD